jgi:hypothetical protein
LVLSLQVSAKALSLPLSAFLLYGVSAKAFGKRWQMGVKLVASEGLGLAWLKRASQFLVLGSLVF